MIRPSLPRFGVSLRTRLTLWYGALLALTVLGFSVLVYVTLEYQLSSAMDEALQLRGDQIRRLIGSDADRLMQPEDVHPGSVESKPLEEFAAPGIYVQVINARGAVIFAPSNLAGGELPIDPQSLAGMQAGQAMRVDVPVGGTNLRILTTPLVARDRVVGGVQVGQSLSPLDATMAVVARQLATAGVLALVTAVVAGWFFTRRALSPVSNVTQMARHIAATGDYGQRLAVPAAPQVGKGDELYLLTSTFNDMIARLEQLLDSQRRLLADTSHELRNPLTVIRGNLALLRNAGASDIARQESLVEAEEEVRRMVRMVEDLLLLARADAGDLPLIDPVPFDLSALVKEVVARARVGANARSIHLEARKEAWVLGDPNRCRQLLANLMDNAMQYTSERGVITVEVATLTRLKQRKVKDRSDRDHPSMSPASPPLDAVVTVTDDGIGMSAEDLSHVFERFFRADRARSRAQGGAGLGLAIAQYIAQAHGGEIQASSDGSGRGSRFRLRLPLLAQVSPYGAHQSDGISPNSPKPVDSSFGVAP